MTRRILCPFHIESTPSCVVYDDSYYCFGCNKSGPIKDLGLTATHYSEQRVKEDLVTSLDYIKALPQVAIRGLTLPVDEKYYYIVWPGGDYYKKRQKVATGGSKYLCPSGHSMPLYEASVGGRKTLAVVEGELNAASFALCTPPFDVVSPGGACTFSSKKYLTFYQNYSTLIIVADADAAGLKAAIELKALALTWTPKVTVHLMERDANSLLVEGGIDLVRLEMQKMVGMA